jgi:hypothetical protein
MRIPGWLGSSTKIKDVGRIAVRSDRARYESVVARVVHGRVEHAVEAENAQIGIILVLIRGIPWNLHDGIYDVRTIRTGIEIDEVGHPRASGG